jgi:hypothetical protein
MKSVNPMTNGNLPEAFDPAMKTAASLLVEIARRENA